MTTTDPTDPGGLIAWRELATPAEVADAIFDLYRRRGESNYDEVVTQTSHAAQCGQLALDDGANAPTIVAAFLHDIGHLLAGERDDRADFLDRDLRHEDIGARFLANWFGPEVTEPIRLHVPAKRYLCAIDPSYHDGLSEASVRSLVLQGGPMTPSEVIAFEELDGHDGAVSLRRWDDGAKVAGASTVSLATFRDLVESVASVASS
ncbi:MAG: HD domain-containing protein [Actinomycetota bacterium]